MIESYLEWPGSGSSPVGKTSFGFYDDDSDFIADAPKVADWCAKELGYPVLSVELIDESFYRNFETAITEYSSTVNSFRIQENMMALQGGSSIIDLTHREIQPNTSRIIKLSEQYGTEAGVGGKVDWKRGWINVKPKQQQYDLNAWAEVSESGKNIEIRRVFHHEPPAASQIYDPTVGTGVNQVLGDFGWSGMAPGITFLMMPVYENLLRMQAIELNNQIRKSGYSFEIINNKIRIMPIPTIEAKIYFDYIVLEDKNTPITDRTNVITDISNAKYDNMKYVSINHPGRQWIRNYTLALSKIMLGNIRGKYQNIPIPNSEVTLNGDSLKQDGIKEKEDLLTKLKEDLEKTSSSNQMNLLKEQNDNLNSMLKNIPLPIYVG